IPSIELSELETESDETVEMGAEEPGPGLALQEEEEIQVEAEEEDLPEIELEALADEEEEGPELEAAAEPEEAPEVELEAEPAEEPAEEPGLELGLEAADETEEAPQVELEAEPEAMAEDLSIGLEEISLSDLVPEQGEDVDLDTEEVPSSMNIDEDDLTLDLGQEADVGEEEVFDLADISSDEQVTEEESAEAGSDELQLELDESEDVKPAVAAAGEESSEIPDLGLSLETDDK
ncbi:MAG: hypothetical protein KAJ60_04565, partial [Desulfobulbaceae bacterium]|nr:hypothetical protein [Desulfobulbaceae bacterium]